MLLHWSFCVGLCFLKSEERSASTWSCERCTPRRSSSDAFARLLRCGASRGFVRNGSYTSSALPENHSPASVPLHLETLSVAVKAEQQQWYVEVVVVVVAAVVVVVVLKPTLIRYTHPKPFRIFAELDEWPGLLWFRPPSEHDKAGANGC